MTTFGERAVGIDFNPSGDRKVTVLKAAFAQAIDECHVNREHSTDPEVKRMLSIAITEAQTAQMWAIKALTWKPDAAP